MLLWKSPRQGVEYSSAQMPCRFVGNWESGRDPLTTRCRPNWKYNAASAGSGVVSAAFTRSGVGSFEFGP